jgi:flagellar hook-basal body complex protein FliE
VRIEGADGASQLPSGPLAPRASTPAAADFAETLRTLVRETDVDQKAAERAATDLANDRGDVVETMVALSKADLSLRAVAEMRNRALEAFHEILRLQV